MTTAELRKPLAAATSGPWEESSLKTLRAALAAMAKKDGEHV